MSPIQQMLLGVGAVASKPYVDDVFSNYLWKATNADRSINIGFDYSNNEGLVWIKNREGGDDHVLYDTLRGANKRLSSNSTAAETTTTTELKSFTSTGYTLGNHGTVNGNDNFSSWNFKSAPGFFDVVTYTGTGSTRTVDHNLGCIPGMILIKRLDTTDNWNVYHRSQHSSNSAGYYLQLNTADSIGGASNRWNDTAPTATQFTVGTAPVVNANGDDFVAYVFAGGEEGYNSVEFDAATESLSATSSDYAFGTGDFTVEAWIKIPNVSGISYQNILDTRGSINNSTSGFSFGVQSNGQLYMYTNGFIINTAVNTITSNQWYHIALVNNGGTAKAYVDGVEKGSVSLSGYDFTNTTLRIANVDTSSGQNFVGSISNVRVVKGTAVYTSAFTAPTAPLTNITNTKLLCCNGDLTTSSTVASGTLSASGSPNTTGTSPFTSSDAVFGDAGDEGVIKCGSYIGNGSSTGPEINLGWEPQWILLKNATAASRDWKIVDAMRGIVTGGDDASLRPNESNDEDDESVIDLTSTGFKITASNAHYNENGETIIYCAIRRTDGYVGKPAEVGTDVFTMDTGNSASMPPGSFDSGFPVDLGIYRQPALDRDWILSTRLTGTKFLETNTTDTEGTDSGSEFDSNTGWYDGASGSYQSWMWKRHAGFDVVSYTGNGVSGRQISHSMNKAVEMLWVKTRDSTENWIVGHKGLDGGSDPWDHEIALNSSAQEANNVNKWNDTAPTSTHFTLGNGDAVNKDGDDYIAMLFASVDGISKVGSFTGTANTQTITTGFQPRFVIIKGTNNSTYWLVLDTVRGWSSGSNDNYLKLNSSDAQASYWWGYPTSTGFVLDTTISGINASGDKCIYYAHA